MDALDPGRAPAVELADHDRAAAAVHDDPRALVVGAEVDEAADRPLGPDDAGDDPLVEPVLDRDDRTLWCEMGRERAGRGLGVLALDAEQHGLEQALEPLRRRRPGVDRIARDRAGDRKARPVDRLHVVRRPVDQQHVPPGPGEGRPDRAADGACSPDDDRRVHAQGPSMSSRVSSTATCQSASMSASGRW